MAVHLATSADYLQRTTGLLPATGNSTVCFWVRYGSISVSPANQTSYIILDDPAVYTNYLGMFSNTVKNTLEADASIVHASLASASVWYHMAWVQSGTTQRLYINGQSIGSVTKNRAAWTVGFEMLGNDEFSDGDLDIAYCREWTTNLNQAQILAEMQVTTAAHTSNLWMDCPLAIDTLDLSGLNHCWSRIGSPTFVSGPTFPSNSTATTATAFGTLPQTLTTNFGDGIYGWFSYTGHPNESIAGFFAYAAIPTDSVSTTVYEDDGTTVILGPGVNVPLNVPQSDGTTVLFLVQATAPLSTSLTFSAVAGPTSPVPIGSIFTNSDVIGFPTMAISATGSDYVPLNYFAFVSTVSENGGDVLTDGSILMVADDDTTLRRYNGQLVQQSVVAGIVTQSATVVRTCLTPQVWYVGNPTGGAVWRIDATGTITHTWALGSSGNTGTAASNDESIIYITGRPTSTNAPIKQWNPNTNSFGADLVAGVANYTTSSLLVLSDDSVLAIYGRFSTSDVFVRRYDAAGTTLNTYQPWGANTVLSAGFTDYSLFHAVDDPVSFWVRLHNVTGVDTSASVYYEIKVSDGSVLNRRIHADFEAGVYAGTPTVTPTARFGIAASCPSFILRAAIAPPTPTPGENTTEYLIRRERWFPVISSGLKRQFFSKLQIDMQTGNGLSTGQGSDPLMEIDWSDDSGWTWSNIRFVQTGKIGAYGWRPIVRNLSYGRNRVFRIAVSDPVQWIVCGADLDAVLGTS
jgi:concanavalin A-like lectin/glucanase superfamily protein